MTEIKVLGQVLTCTLLFMLIHFTTAQELMMCFQTEDSCPNGDATMMTYADCCTGDDPLNTSYTPSCIPCGPVIEPGSVFPFNIRVGAVQTIFLEWRLAPNSMPAGRYIVTNQEVIDGVPGPTFFLSVDGGTTTFQFVNLRTSITYRFMIIAVSVIDDQEVQAPPVVQEWTAGDNTLPRFTNFTGINSTTTTFTASWILDNSGITDLTQMIVRWVEAPETIQIDPTVLLQQSIGQDPSLVFPDTNVALTNFDMPVPDGQQFSQTFAELESSSEYIVRIEGVNSAGTSVTLFAFRTGDGDGEGPTVLIDALRLPEGSAGPTTYTLSLVLLAASAAIFMNMLL